MAKIVCVPSDRPVDESQTGGSHPVSPCARALVCDLVASHLAIEVDSIHDADGLADLGLDPLDLVLVVLKIEDLCGDPDFPLTELSQARTVADFVALVDLWLQEDTAIAPAGPYKRHAS